MPKPIDQAGRVWLILGASSAIARAFARHVARGKGSLILAGRDLDDLADIAGDLRVHGAPSVDVVRFDATDRGSQNDLVRHCLEHVPSGALDVYVGFGVMPPQELMEAEPERAAMAITATFTAAAETLLRIVPLLEIAGRGNVVVIGSVAGDRGRRRNYIYGSAKAGLSVFAAGLRARLAARGVHVLTVKPGFVDTSMTWGLNSVPFSAAPDRVAYGILSAVDRRILTCYTPWFWRFIMATICMIPERVMMRLKF